MIRLRITPKVVLAAIVLALTLGTVTGLAVSAVARADVFSACPDGHEGVVGEHTSCSFAEVIRSGFFKWGTNFDAFSPETHQWYHVDCDAVPRPADMGNGITVSSVNCYTGNAEVVVW